MVLKRAVFLDRDGVINRNRDDCIHSFEQFQWIPGSFEAIVKLCRAGLAPALITNQSCIGRGWVPESRIRAMHSTIQNMLNVKGGGFTAVYYCPHNPKANCHCRKPKGAMLRRALKDYKVGPRDAVFIGDNITDFQAAKLVGVPFILVLTGRGAAAKEKIAASDPALWTVQANLAHAVDFLARA
jgi:D-glycero-D-manno-heptose 1,7-bisphosphate phosphatase